MNKALELLKKRHSVRSYKPEPVADELIQILKSEMTFINSHEAGLFFQIRTNDPEPFSGFRRSYGFFKNARNYIACVVDTSYPNTLERAGYFAESLVIKMTEIGLGSCFVGGTFDSNSTDVHIRAGQSLQFLILFGYEDTGAKRPVMKLMTKLMHRNEPAEHEYFVGSDTDYSEAKSILPNLNDGLQGIMLAPSSLNKRPVRIELSKDSSERNIVAFVDDSNQKNLIDLGIAKFNFAFATGTEWEWGNHAPLLI